MLWTSHGTSRRSSPLPSEREDIVPIPQDAYQRLTTYLTTHQLSQGLGTREAACSVAAINLALTGRLTDDIPDCMSLPLGGWIIGIQDAMPDYIRNSTEWKTLLPEAAGTGRDKETERTQLIVDWMWDDVLPQLLPVVRKWGFEAVWQEILKILSQRTDLSALTAWEALASVDDAAANEAANLVAEVAAAVAVVVVFHFAPADDFRAAYMIGAAHHAARVAGYTAVAVNYAEDAPPVSAYWDRIDPCRLLHKLITI
jgi:hypothetical protein